MTKDDLSDDLRDDVVQNKIDLAMLKTQVKVIFVVGSMFGVVLTTVVAGLILGAINRVLGV